MGNIGGDSGNIGSDGTVTTAQAYVYVENVSGTPTIRYEFNVSSITDSGVGNFVVNFRNALASDDYSITGNASASGSSAVSLYENTSVSRTSSSVPVKTSIAPTSTLLDAARWGIHVFGG